MDIGALLEDALRGQVGSRLRSDAGLIQAAKITNLHQSKSTSEVGVLKGLKVGLFVIAYLF